MPNSTQKERATALLHAVPFTPSQGIKTPSPHAYTARRYMQQGDFYFAGSPLAGIPLTPPLQAWTPAMQQARTCLA